LVLTRRLPTRGVPSRRRRPGSGTGAATPRPAPHRPDHPLARAAAVSLAEVLASAEGGVCGRGTGSLPGARDVLDSPLDQPAMVVARWTSRAVGPTGGTALYSSAVPASTCPGRRTALRHVASFPFAQMPLSRPGLPVQRLCGDGVRCAVCTASAVCTIRLWADSSGRCNRLSAATVSVAAMISVASRSRRLGRPGRDRFPSQ
jgi:hypothetical protein